ncbi:MAG: DUF6431 domain-containing protein [Clostridia bacterium]
MIFVKQKECPMCCGRLEEYDRVRRIVRTKKRTTSYIYIRRMKCTNCSKIHRELPSFLLPYKQYEKEVVYGVLEDIITSETIGFEDYPCEKTMIRWRTQKTHILLWRT